MKTCPMETDSDRKGETKLETYRLAIQDARHVFNTYKATLPVEAWETLRKIIFNEKLK